MNKKSQIIEFNAKSKNISYCNQNSWSLVIFNTTKLLIYSSIFLFLILIYYYQ